MAEFIPKPYSTEQVTFRIKIDTLKHIDHAASAAKISRSAFINQCIDFALAHMKDHA